MGFPETFSLNLIINRLSFGHSGSAERIATGNAMLAAEEAKAPLHFVDRFGNVIVTVSLRLLSQETY